MSAMAATARILRYTAFTLMALFGLLGGLFAAGYAFEDLSTWVAVGSTLAVAVPTIVLSVLAFRLPDATAPWFVALTGLVAVGTLLDAGFQLVDRDAVGPVVAIGVFALAVSLAVLGLHRSALAGVLLLLLGAAQLGGVVLGFSGELAEGGGPSLGAVLTTSSGVVVVPLLVVGLLFVVAGALTHDSLRVRHLPPTAHPAH
ncbi:hypothetical protein GCM10023168_20170 [Fodinibacter luteus]|uniref:Uncharacterized protein n=1 Tax=Fodinibacter luteus TaxID=552064 RepID=A0ABP8KG72_9MICO